MKLLFKDAFINGQWHSAINRRFKVTNPATQSVIAEVTDCGAVETRWAIHAAHEALPAWSALTAAARGKILQRWFELIDEQAEALAQLLTTEQGKAIAEARGEVAYGASFLRWYAAEAERVYGDTIPATKSDQRITVLRQPIGVVAAITPWNFPVAMITRKVGPALAAGCTVVVKPAEDTPLCALALAHLADQAGLPAGVLNVVPTSDPAAVGEVLTSDQRVRKLSFTGSTDVGKLLMKQCADTVKKLSLELGGNAPFIVFADADIPGAVAGAMASKYRNAGQTCICANRFYVHASVATRFKQSLVAAVADLVVGDGRVEGTDIGPLIHQSAAKRVRDVVNQAVQAGATAEPTWVVKDSNDNFVPPVVLSNIQHPEDLHDVELFGPVAPIFTFTEESEVIAAANNTQYGLAAYFYGKDYAQIWRVAEALDYGMVGINTGAISTAVAPFGGVKESGFGREGGKYGIEEYLVTKYLCWQL